MRRGFSLLELMVSVTCLTLISVGLFAIFEMCSSNFRLGLTRQTLQSQIITFSARFGVDVRQCSVYSAQVNERSVSVDLDPGNSSQTVTVRRDSICLSALKDASNPASYEAVTGLPMWDCFWVYTATAENPTGQLVRYRKDIVPPSSAQVKLGDFGTNPVAYSLFPSPMAAPRTTQVLARGLFKLEGQVDVANQQIVVRVAFRGERGHTAAGGRSLAEVAETLFRIKPENSWPRM